MAQNSPSGERTSEYYMVLERYVAIVDAIRAVSSAKESLISHYKQRKWCSIRETPATVSEAALVDCALERIKEDCCQFFEFIEMLNQTKVFVKGLSGMLQITN